MAGISRFKNLYLYGTGEALVPESQCRNGMPRFWVIRCHK